MLLRLSCSHQALLNSSHMFYEAKNSFAHHGVIVGDLKYDWEAMQKQKSTAVGGLTKGIEGLLKKNKVRWMLHTKFGWHEQGLHELGHA